MFFMLSPHQTQKVDEQILKHHNTYPSKKHSYIKKYLNWSFSISLCFEELRDRSCACIKSPPKKDNMRGRGILIWDSIHR